MNESPTRPRQFPSATHWGCYRADVDGGRLKRLVPHEDDPDPSPLGEALAGAVEGPCRVGRPMVRAGYLDRRWHSDTCRRGVEPFVPVEWDEALDIAAAALSRVRDLHGNEAIFAGSYGWASAGRFHHAQSQIHRFMNQFGGYTRSVDTYSTAAGEVVLRHVLGRGTKWVVHAPGWADIAANAELVVAFGGLPLKNTQVNAGIVGRHGAREGLRQCRDKGVEFVCISPMATDVSGDVEATWMPLRPNTDTALMLGLAHTLVVEDLVDREFIGRYCQGYERFRAYLTGEADGRPKDAAWVERLTGVAAANVQKLARRMAEKRTLVSVSWSVQRADHGEQPYWMAVTLAAMLGEIGLAGRGIGFGLCAVNGVGQPRCGFDWMALDQGLNPVETFIPVARIADMLLAPGSELDYDGRKLRLPDIRLIYWAGGNPFHHHQDLNRLLLAWRRPETIIVHEPWWTATARHADIVFPVTTALERNDFACSSLDARASPMHRAIAPVGDSRSDFDIFAGLARRLGLYERFTEGRDEMAWVRALYAGSRRRAADKGIALPDFDSFWQGGVMEPAVEEGANWPDDPLAAFRADPLAHPLATPSGRIELFSETVAGFGYDDCPGHPVWLEPAEWLGGPLAATYPLHLISNQPRSRLHSQLDTGSVSRSTKIRGREPILMNPEDAGARRIGEGDIVRVFNARGACLAGAVLSPGILRGVVQMSTGAWYDPLEPGRIGTLDRHGNPNVLTRDAGTSRLAQGPSAQTTLVEVERYDDDLPDLTVLDGPALVSRGPAG